MGERVYEEIRRSIVEGQFAGGEQLVETHLATELGVSRGPVREALRRLREEGLVVDRPTRGVCVREFTLDDVVDIYNVRIGLESVAIRLVTRLRAPTDGLRSLIDEMADAAVQGDSSLLNERELAFHMRLCELSENKHVVALFRALAGQVRMAFRLDNAQYADPQSVAMEHEPLVEAIGSNDENKAERLLVEHIANSLEALLERTRQDNDSNSLTRLLTTAGTSQLRTPR